MMLANRSHKAAEYSHPEWDGWKGQTGTGIGRAHKLERG